MEEEIWTPIINWPQYLISNQGRISRDGRVRKPTKSGKYLMLALTDKKRRQEITVHRQVLLAFDTNGEQRVVRHLDGDPLNNNLSNLAWGTHKDNEADKRRHGRVLAGSRNPLAKLTEEDVIKIRSSPDKSAIQWSKELGVSPSAVRHSRRGVSWSYLNGTYTPFFGRNCH